MRKRWWWVVVGLLAGTLLLVCATRRCDFTRQDFKRLRLGMTLAEVETVLGCPAGDYRTMETYGVGADDPLEDRILGSLDGVYETFTFWEGDAGIISVCFDESGKAVLATHIPQRPRYGVTPSPVEKLAWRFKRYCRRLFP